MSDVFKMKAIQDLSNEVGCLTGGQFEQFGYALLSAVVGEDFDARGTTICGAPRGYTVDGTAFGADYVYEASSEAGYFDKGLSKLNADLNHAVSKHPKCSKIWLLSALEKSPRSGTEIANAISDFKRAHAAVQSVLVWGSREIASQIVASLDSDVVVRSLQSYLPSLLRLADENAFSHRLPSREGYLDRSDEERAAIDLIRAQPVVTVAGISGAGKSVFTCAVAEQLRDSFETIIWLDATALTDTHQLEAVEIGRYGLKHNVVALMKRRKTLLVLDDLIGTIKGNLEELAMKDSRIVITTQATDNPKAMHIPQMSITAARQLLERRSATPCPDSIFELVWSTVGGYPLLLAALNREAVQTGDWEAVKECCFDVVSATEDDRHEKVCQRILKRHAVSLASELTFVRWLDSSRFDSQLARACVSSKAVVNLEKRDFLTAAPSGMMKVHDVVFKSILATVPPNAQAEATFRAKLEDFIGRECESDNGVLDRLARRHGELFARLLRSDARAAFVYAGGLARSASFTAELLGDPVASAEQLEARQTGGVEPIEVRAVIEAVEAQFTLRSRAGHPDEAARQLEAQLPAFDSLSRIACLQPALSRDIKHHRAKMLAWLGKKADALAEFDAIVATWPSFAAARLQAAKLLSDSRRDDDAAAHTRYIVEQARTAPTTVSVNILLDALSLLARSGTEADIAVCEADIVNALNRSAETDVAIAYRLVASVTGKAHYTRPEFVVRLFRMIAWLEYLPTSDKERFDWAQAHKFAAKAAGAAHADFVTLLRGAVVTYATIRFPNPFQLVQSAEAHLLLQDPKSALAVLANVSDATRDEFWHQREAQALHALARTSEALNAIEGAISRCRKPEVYLPAFYRDRARIRRAATDANAIDDLRAARSLLPDGDKFRSQLDDEIAEWQADGADYA